MAETNSSLGYTSKLQIVIVPSGKEYSTPESKTGLLIFREGTNIIEVNGHEYQAAKTGDLSKITEALKNTGYLTVGSNGVLTANNPGTVKALLGTKISTAASGTAKTVSDWITDLQGQITAIGKRVSTNESNITNLKNATAIDGSGNFVVRDKSGAGKTDFANTTAIQEAINDAKQGAIDSAATDASQKDDQVKKDLIGTGTASESSSKPLEPGGGNTWALNEAKTLSSLKDLILNLQGQLTTLSGKDLTAVNNAITAIKKELSDGSEAGDLANTLIDKLSTFLGGKTSWTINGTTAANVGAIITALETEIKARIASVGKADGEQYINVITDSNKKVTVSSTDSLKNAVKNANSAIQSVNNGTNETLITVGTTDKAVTVSSTTSLQTAVTNANSAIQSVGADSGEQLIAVTTTGKNVSVSSTSKLQTAVNNANNALPKGNSTYASAVDLANKLKGTAGDSKDKTTIEGAKTYAKETAKTYADSVITWTVIS